MNNEEAFVQLAMNMLQCSQKELAVRLGVSPTQISKWKKGEHMSPEMESKFRTITKIGDKDPNFVILAGGLGDAEKWERLIQQLAALAQFGEETGYDTEPLNDEYGLLCSNTFDVLQKLGVTLPNNFPDELAFDYEDDDGERFAELRETNPYVQIIGEIFRALTDVYGFYAAYISELILDEELDLYDTAACNIEPCLLDLAASKIEDKHEFTPYFLKFKSQVRKNYQEWLTIVKDRAFRAGVPLRAELLNLIYASTEELGSEAEVESLGFNASRIHPDIYMNELLTGMRVIHQVLPSILKKLGLENEFELDTSELRLN